MGLFDMLTSQLNGNAIQQLSNQLGADTGSVSNALQAALPMLLGALERKTHSEAGAEALHASLNREHDGTLLDNVAGFFGQPPTAQETQMVDDLLGERRQAAEQAIGQVSGLQGSAVGTLLSNLAPVLMGLLGQQTRSGGLGISALAGLLGQETQQLQSQQPAAMGLVNKFLDADGDGDVDLSDLITQGTGLLQRFLRG